MATIRPYQPGDKENVRHICIQTGPARAMEAGPDQSKLLTCYCDYYIECEPHNCFVIADDADQAVGYILCAEDCRQYRAQFLHDYAPRTKELTWFHRMECHGSAILPWFFRKRYPAHLHIDILPDYQRMGLGSQLMNALTAHLREKGIPGVMLAVGADNQKGRSFYRKYGFRTLLHLPGVVVMGLDLRSIGR